jgi:hypothetical protein
MLTRLTRIFDFDTRKGLFKAFLLVLIFKLSLLVFKILFIKHGSPIDLPGFWGIWGGDTNGYLNAFDDLRTKGEYLGGYRMPLYGFVYFIFRLVVSRIAALNALLLFQIVVAAFAVVYSGRIVYEVTKNKLYGLFTAVIVCVAFQTLLYDWYLLPQSLVGSFLVFFAYHSIRYFKTLSIRNLRLAVLFSFLIFFLYPVFVGVAFFLFVGGLYYNKRHKIVFIRRLFVVLIPFIVLEGLWIYRNYVVFHNPHPLAATYNAFSSKPDNQFKHELFQFGMATGIDICAWQPHSEMRYFQHMKVSLANGTDGYDNDAKFPLELVSGTPITADSLSDLRRRIDEVRHVDDVANLTDSLKIDTLEAELNRFTAYMKNDKPYLYWIGSRLRIMKQFFKYKGDDSVFFRVGNNSSVVKLLKPYVQLIYCVSLFISLLFPISILVNKNNRALNCFFLSMLLYVIFIFPVVFKVIEHRYFSSGFPFVVIAAMITIYNFLSWRNEGKPVKRIAVKEKVYA